jgi:hypothetical protein
VLHYNNPLDECKNVVSITQQSKQVHLIWLALCLSREIFGFPPENRMMRLHAKLSGLKLPNVDIGGSVNFQALELFVGDDITL